MKAVVYMLFAVLFAHLTFRAPNEMASYSAGLFAIAFIGLSLGEVFSSSK